MNDSMDQQVGNRGGSGLGIHVTPKLIVFIVLLVLAVLFAAQNSERVDLTLFFWDFELRLVWALLAFALIGAILGWMVPKIRSGSRRRQR